MLSSLSGKNNGAESSDLTLEHKAPILAKIAEYKATSAS